MYALERGFKNKKAGRILAILFALFASLAAFGIGASTQSNSLADALYNTSLIDGKAIPQWLVGAVVAVSYTHLSKDLGAELEPNGSRRGNQICPLQARMTTVDPVSYTHLDVYKRQELYRRACRFARGKCNFSGERAGIRRFSTGLHPCLCRPRERCV